jgi:hypothetical protein
VCAGVPLKANLTLLKEDPPHIVVGTPGRVKDLLSRPDGLKLDKVKFFVLDECDKMLEAADMRADVQRIFVQVCGGWWKGVCVCVCVRALVQPVAVNGLCRLPALLS